MIKTLRVAAFGAAGVLVLATFLTSFILDIVFIAAAVGLVVVAMKYMK